MDSYAKAFHFKAAEQKTSQIWRNTHLSHIAHIPAVQTPQRLSDTSVYICANIHANTCTRTMYITVKLKA